MKYVAALITWLLVSTFVVWMCAGCATTKKLVEVDTPVGYRCNVHGSHPKSYRVGDRYFCTLCVDMNMEKVEMVWSAIPTTREVN